MALATAKEVECMFDQMFFLIYRLFLDRGGKRVSWVIRNFGADDGAELYADIVGSEADAYSVVFSHEGRSRLEGIYFSLLDGMNGLTYQQCDDALEALSFIQEISAAALWKYRLDVGAEIEFFVREFDRLDVPEERVRLYRRAQKN